MKNIKKIEHLIKENGYEKYIIIPAGDNGYYFVAIHSLIECNFQDELLKIAESENWDAQWCPDPDSHIEDGDVPENWEGQFSVLNLL